MKNILLPAIIILLFTAQWATSNNVSLCAKLSLSDLAAPERADDFPVAVEESNALPADLTVTGTPSPVLCHGGNTGSVSITVNGGTSPYTYLWSNGHTEKNITGLTAGWYSLTVTDAANLTVTGTWEVTEPAILEITRSAPRNPNCNGASNGAILLTVSGGTSGYTYLYEWNDGATTEDRPCCLLANCYTVTVTDAHGCLATGNWCLTEPPALSVTGIITPERCNGGSNGAVNITVAGNTSPYSYDWSNGETSQNLSGLSSGVYTVMVTDAEGCPSVYSWDVTQPEIITAIGIASPVTIYGGNNGSISLTVGGGTSPYQYVWSNGETAKNITGLTAGRYFVTITDANTCHIGGFWDVTQPNAATIIGTPFPVLCNGGHTGSIDVTVGGGNPPYQYLWNNGETVKNITGLTAGSYTITVTDVTNIPVTGSWEVTEPPVLQITKAAPRNPSCNGSGNGAIFLTVVGGTPGYSYIYVWNDGTTTEDRPCCLIADCYIVTVTDAHGCQTSDFWCLTEPPALSIDCSALPALCHGDASGSIDLNIAGGNAPYFFDWSNGETTQDIYGLTSGVYTVNAADDDGCVISTSCEVTEPELLTVSGTAIPALCFYGNSGSVNLTVGGGSTPYQYLWNTGQTIKNLTGLTEGHYSVTITDANSCKTNGNWDITIADPPIVAGTTSPVICHGGNTGSINTTASNGTAPYAYFWNNGKTVNEITGLTAGWYTVTITDANTCQTSGSWEIIQPEAPLIIGMPYPALCNKGSTGSVSITMSGGTSPYTYAWNNGVTSKNITGLTAGIYTVTITDANTCNASGDWEVLEPDPLAVDAGADQLLCQQFTAVLTGSWPPAGGTGSWTLISRPPGTPLVTPTPSNSPMAIVTGLLPDETIPYVFKYTVTSGTCSNSDTMKVFNKHYPYPPYAGADQQLCFHLPTEVYMTANPPLYGYGTGMWSQVPGNPSASIANIYDPHTKITYTTAGTYKFLWTVGNGVCDPGGTNHDTCVVKVFAVPALNAGPDAGLCGIGPYTVTGSSVTENCTTLHWTTSGTGTFNYSTILHPAYTPGPADIAAGSVTLTLSGIVGCCSPCGPDTLQDSMVLFFKIAPDPAVLVTAQVTCFGLSNGSFATTVTGGTQPFTYLWSNGQTTLNATGLSAGTYTVTVADYYGCQGTASGTLTQPSVLSLTGISANINCYGYSVGMVNLTVAGGTTPYGYAWSNGATSGNISGLTAGTYAVTVTDANTCQTGGTWVITQPDPFLVTGTPYPALCNKGSNGSINITVIGGISSYNYLWNNGETVKNITGLTAGTYTVTITDANNCQASGAWEVTQPAPLTVDAGTDQLLCQQFTAVLTGNPPPAGGTVAWTLISQPPGTPLVTPVPSNSPIAIVVGLLPDETVPYIFRYTITSGNCSNSDTMKVLNKHYPLPPYAGSDKEVCYQLPKEVYMTASPPLFGYGTGVWSQVPGNPSASIANIYDPHTKITYTTAGTYKFLWTVGNGVCDPGGTNHDTCVIKVYDLPFVNAGPDAGICSGAPYTITGSSVSETCTSLLWITSGTGTFDNDTILDPTYTPGIADISAGNVTLTLTGAVGCCTPCGPATVQDFMVLTFYPVPSSAIIVSSPVTCYGLTNGALTMSVSGGTLPLTYLWNNGQTTVTATGLSAGTYSATVTDYHGCKGTATGILITPSSISLTGIATNVNCYGYNTGNVNLSISGGTTPYGYIWNNGASTMNISGLSTGTYSVTVTDANGCKDTHSWVVNEPPAWTIGIDGYLMACCNTSAPAELYSYSATVGGAFELPLTWQWVVEGGTIESGQNSQTIGVRWSCCGTGKVWLTVNQGSVPCSSTTHIDVTIHPTPAPVISGPVQVISNQGNYQYCTPLIPAHLYSWTVVGGTIASGWGTNCITVNWGSYPACGCGSVTVCESSQVAPGVVGCTGCTTLGIVIAPNAANVNLQGFVRYDNSPYNTPLNDVIVTLKDLAGNIVGNVNTTHHPANGDPGYYAFTNVPDGDYHLTASSANTWGGNNATDALIIQLNILGLYPLYYLRNTVADVNQSLSVTALDALYVKLRTISSITSYPAGDWKFTDTTFTLTAAASVNLKGLCTGDVNGSYIPGGLKESSSISVLSDNICAIPVNEWFNCTISNGELANLGATTLYLNFNPEKYEISEVHTALDGSKYAIGHGTIAIAWANINPVTITEGDPLFVFRMKIKEAVVTPEQIFSIQPGSEFASYQAIKYENYKLRMSSVITEPSIGGITLNSYPNPFSETTEINYTIPETGYVKLILTDMLGNIVNVMVDATQNKGFFKIFVNPADFNMSAGIYFCKLEVRGASETYQKVHRMIFTK